uniref:SDE2-like domain-containing protein n=1 Tax=Anopheles culicifacies TaxID=139723 RepID=A0A182MG00_9DIPT
MLSIVYGDNVLEVEAESVFACNIAVAIERWTGLQPSDYYCTQNGRRVSLPLSDGVRPDVPLRIWERLPGGKGGFGSMLRAIGAQIEKTTNREACRDLSGRRLRDINEEKRLKAYLDKQQEEGDGNDQVKVEIKISKLLSKPKHEFEDKKYDHARSELVVAADEAIQEGMHKAIELEMGRTESKAMPSTLTSDKLPTTSQSMEPNRKRKHPDGNIIKAKKSTSAMWMSPDDLSSSSDTDDENEDERSDEYTVKKLVTV